MTASCQTVLLVDDSPVDLLASGKVLEAPGREVVTASSGEEALELAVNLELALIVLDVFMEGIDGFETAERLRRQDALTHVPIIFLTGASTSEEQVFKGYDSGAVDYLFKPVEPHLLRSKAEVFCELSAQKALIQEQLNEIQRKNEELRRQLEEINTLRGLIPICAACKNVRDDSGYWQSIEGYLSSRSEAEFSHAVCPECARKLYPDYVKQDS